MINLSFPRFLSSPREKEGGKERKGGGVRLPHSLGITSTSPPLHIDPPPSSSLGGLPTPPEECTQRWARLPGLSFSHLEVVHLWFLQSFFPLLFLSTFLWVKKRKPLILWAVHKILIPLKSDVAGTYWRATGRLNTFKELSYTTADEKITETQAYKMSLWVPDKCSLLIGHGWARVPPQKQCTTNVSSRGRRGKTRSGRESGR